MTRRTPNKSARGVPHFLRVTQALAFVSGVGAPSAAMLVATADCGGAAFSGAPACDACGSDAPASSDGFAPGVVAPVDGSPPDVLASADGSRDSPTDAPYDGIRVGVTPLPSDAASDASLPGIVIPIDAAYDGRPMGVMPLPGDAASDRSFPGIQIPPDAALLDGGGPLLPPELAA
jgi:hypothetical protein